MKMQDWIAHSHGARDEGLGCRGKGLVGWNGEKDGNRIQQIAGVPNSFWDSIQPNPSSWWISRKST